MAFSWFKKKQEAPKGPDYHAIDSLVKAQAAYQRGELAMIYLFPLVFGGAEEEINREITRLKDHKTHSKRS